MIPIDPDVQLAWDRACERAGKSRGLGFELLARSLPDAASGSAIVARCPEPALLGVEAARASARSFLREALADSLLDLEVLPPDGSEDWSLSFASRSAARAESARLRALEDFVAEELSERAQASGARIDPASFRLWP